MKYEHVVEIVELAGIAANKQEIFQAYEMTNIHGLNSVELANFNAKYKIAETEFMIAQKKLRDAQARAVNES